MLTLLVLPALYSFFAPAAAPAEDAKPEPAFRDIDQAAE